MPTEELNEINKTLDDLRSRIKKLEEKVFAQDALHPAEERSGPNIDVDVGGLTYLKELKSALDKCLAVLDQLFSKDPGHPGLTPDEFAQLFRETFRLPVPLVTISSQLGSASGKFVKRRKIAAQPVKYRYQILPRGQEYVRKRIASLQGAEHA
jgi:hypothetical protein